MNIYISTHLFLPDHSKTITDDVTLTLSYITLHYYTFPFEISSPCTKTELTHMRTRLYNAAASPASRLRSAGSLAKNPNFLILYTYYQVFYRYFMADSSYTFSKNLQFDYLFLEIFRLQLRKKPFLLMDSKRDRYLQWLPTMIRNENALLSVMLLQLCQR